MSGFFFHPCKHAEAVHHTGSDRVTSLPLHSTVYCTYTTGSTYHQSAATQHTMQVINSAFSRAYNKVGDVAQHTSVLSRLPCWTEGLHPRQPYDSWAAGSLRVSSAGFSLPPLPLAAEGLGLSEKDTCEAYSTSDPWLQSIE